MTRLADQGADERALADRGRRAAGRAGRGGRLAAGGDGRGRAELPAEPAALRPGGALLRRQLRLGPGAADAGAQPHHLGPGRHAAGRGDLDRDAAGRAGRADAAGPGGPALPGPGRRGRRRYLRHPCGGERLLRPHQHQHPCLWRQHRRGGAQRLRPGDRVPRSASSPATTMRGCRMSGTAARSWLRPERESPGGPRPAGLGKNPAGRGPPVWTKKPGGPRPAGRVSGLR